LAENSKMVPYLAQGS